MIYVIRILYHKFEQNDLHHSWPIDNDPHLCLNRLMVEIVNV